MTALANKTVDFNWGRVFAFAVAFLVAALAFIEPAYAFAEFESTMTSRTREATDTGKTILYAAAVLALLVGVAPMLWGQVKVKWIISCCVAAVLFGVVGTVITAFQG